MTTKTDDIKLLACPFCGGQNLDIEMDDPPYVMCHDCGAYGPDTLKPDARPSDVAEVWNRRAAVEADQPADGQILEDVLIYGIGVSIDGKRIAPQDFYMPDRQDRMPSDDEIDKLSHGFALQYQDHVRGFAHALLSRYGSQPVTTAPSDESISGLWRECSQAWIQGKTGTPLVQLFARAVLSRYGSSQPAASAEPTWHVPGIGEVHSSDHKSMIYCEVEDAEGEMVVSDSLPQRVCNALNGFYLDAPVAQEPPQVTDAEIEQIVTGAGARWDGSVWKVEDADLHPMARALLYRYTTAPVAAQLHVTDEMVTRFLGWHLPQDFAPDAGISFNPSPDPHSWPVGTNLLTDPQARAMLEYVLTGVQK